MREKNPSKTIATQMPPKQRQKPKCDWKDARDGKLKLPPLTKLRQLVSLKKQELASRPKRSSPWNSFLKQFMQQNPNLPFG